MAHILKKRSCKWPLATVLIATVLSLSASGCGAGSSAAPGTNPLSGLHGSAFGGRQPIAGAVIQLWAVGLPSSGGSYGAGQTALISSTVKTDSGGNFTITGDYSCSTGQYVYITSTGGNPGSGTNSSAVLMAALGDCSLLTPSTFININEATTVAGVWSLQRFANATFGTAGSFTVGAPSTNLQGLKNAFAAVNNLVNTSTGQIPASVSTASTINGTSMSIVATNEQSKIGTLANILAACVNSTDTVNGSNTSPSTICSSLFSSVQPSGQTNAPADTLQAALDMALNPTNVGSATTPPYSIAASSPPYSPSLSSVPADFTLGLSFSSSQLLGTSPVQNYFFYHAYTIAVDSNGNIYVDNGPNGSTSSPYYNSVAEISPAGKALASYVDTGMLAPRGMAIDTNNNIWVANSGSSGTDALTEITSSGTMTPFTYTAPLYAVAVSGQNDVFATSSSSLMLTKLVGGTGSFVNVGGINSSVLNLAIDSTNSLWLSSNGAGVLDYFKATCTTLPCTYPSSYTSYSGFSGTYGIAIDSSDTPWVALNTTSQVEKGNPAVTSAGGTKSTANLGGINTPEFVAFDGNGDLWVTNATNSSSASVTELAPGSTTVALSPSVGFVHNYDLLPRGIAIDGSGNVWIGNQNGQITTASPTITEIVGAAYPVMTPLASAIAAGKLGRLP